MLGHVRLGMLTAVAVTALAGVTPTAHAQSAPAHTQEDYTHERFAELQAEGALILVDIFADWCPTCAIQQEVLAGYRAANPEVPLHTLTIDFDTQKDFVTHFRAPRQSTLILYLGEEQIWFSIAETRGEVIAAALDEGAAGH